MKTRFFAANWAVLALVASFIGGCASYKPPVAMPEDKIPAAKVKAARDRIALYSALSQDIETVVAANAAFCTNKGSRLPFFLLSNEPVKDVEVRAAYLNEGLTDQPRIFSTGAATAAVNGKYVTAVEGTDIAPTEVAKAFQTILLAANTKPTVSFTFSDKTAAKLVPHKGCIGIILLGGPKGHAWNFGTGMEILSTDWFVSAKSLDARQFLAGRSLYFASDAGAQRLNKNLFASALAQGVLKTLTFNLSTILVGDAKDLTVKLVRDSAAKDADAYGLRAAVRAGADPKVVMAFVRAMAQETARATEYKELWFEDGRVEALEVVFAGLPAKPAAPAVADAVLAAPTALAGQLSQGAD